MLADASKINHLAQRSKQAARGLRYTEDTMATPTKAEALEAIDPAEHVASLSDVELIADAFLARDDLTEAATSQPESEWHQACFAACIMYGQELGRRGIDLRTLN